MIKKAVTAIARIMAAAVIVPILYAIQAIIANSFPLLRNLYLFCQLYGLLIRTDEHPNHKSEYNNCGNYADNIYVSCEQTAELVDHQRDRVGKSALISDGELRPLGVVHLTTNGADSGKARCAEQVEHKERISGDTAESFGKRCIDRAGAAVQNTHRADDVFLCHKSRDRRNSCLPRSPAERYENLGNGTADSGKNGLIRLFFAEHPEAVGCKAEIGGEPNKNRRKQDDRPCLFDERPAALPH